MKVEISTGLGRAWRHATGSTLKETGEHFDIPASTIGSWSSKIQVNIGTVEPEIALDEQPLGGEGVFEDGDQVTHDMTYRFVNNRKIYWYFLILIACQAQTFFCLSNSDDYFIY